jgi:hypothetical protein
MQLVKEITVSWEEFPDSFAEKYADQLLLADAEDDGVVCVITYDYTPYIPGRYHGPPDKCYPSEGPDVDIDNIVYVIHPQRAATGPLGLRLYEHPVWRDSEGMPVVTPYPGNLAQKFDDAFLEIAQNFAAEWVELHATEIREQLLDYGKQAHSDGIAAVLADIEAEADRRRDRDIEDRLVEGAAADWEASRKSGGDR